MQMTRLTALVLCFFLGQALPAMADSSGKPTLSSSHTVASVTTKKVSVTFGDGERQALESGMAEMLSQKNFSKGDYKIYLLLPSQRQDQILQCYKIGLDTGVSGKHLLLGVSTAISLQRALDDQKKLADDYQKKGTLGNYIGQKLIELLDDIAELIPGAEQVFDRKTLQELDTIRVKIDRIANTTMKKETDAMKKETDAMKKETDAMKKETAKMRKNIELLDALLKAL